MGHTEYFHDGPLNESKKTNVMPVRLGNVQVTGLCTNDLNTYVG